jgi:hypothetical protein
VINTTIQLRLDTATGPVVATSTTNAAGLATFSIPGISDSDYHTLVATAGGFETVESLPFQVIETFPCTTSTSGCTATVAGAETTVTVTGSGGSGTGLLLLSLNFGPDPRCEGYTPPTPDWYEFGVTVQRTKTVDIVYDASAVKDIGGVSKLEVCFAALRQFGTKGAALQPFDYEGDPRTGPAGNEGWVGLLPDCRYGSSQPCILKRLPLDDDHRDAYGHPSGGSRALVRVLVPLDWGDPRMH